MIAFKKDISLETNLEVVPIYTGGVYNLTYEAWVVDTPTVIATASLPVDHVTSQRIPGENDRLRVRWSTSGNNLTVQADYYDYSAGSWTINLINDTSDMTGLGSHDFSAAHHSATSITVDSTYFSIKNQAVGQKGASASASVSPSVSPSASVSPSESSVRISISVTECIGFTER